MKVTRFDSVLLAIAIGLGIGGVILLSRQTTIAGALLGAAVALFLSVLYTTHERGLQDKQSSELRGQVAQLTIPAVRTALRLGDLFYGVQTSLPPAARQRQALAQSADALEAWSLRDYATGWNTAGNYYGLVAELDDRWPSIVGTAARVGYELVLSFALCKEPQEQQAETNTALLCRDLAELGIPSAIVERAGKLLRSARLPDDPLPASQRELLIPRLLIVLRGYVEDWLTNVSGEADARLGRTERLILNDEELLGIQPADGSERIPALDAMAGTTQAILLPSALEETEILSRLAIGETAFTVPWAMAVSEDGRCYLNGGYTTEARPGGTVTMKVERKEEGFVVTVPPTKRYSTAERPPWVGSGLADIFPVVEVRIGDVEVTQNSRDERGANGTIPISKVDWDEYLTTRILRGIRARHDDLLELDQKHPGLFNNSTWIDCDLDTTRWPPAIQYVTLVDTLLRDSQWILENASDIRLVGTRPLDGEIPEGCVWACADRMRFTGRVTGVAIVGYSAANADFSKLEVR